MALATPLITVQDGTGNASNNVAANAVAIVTPGNAVTFGLQSTTGVQMANFVIAAQPGSSLDGMRSPTLTGNGPFTWTIQLPPAPVQAFTLYTEVTDGFNLSQSTNTITVASTTTSGLVHRARFVSAANNESLTAFVGVTGGTARDGVNGVQGDVVLLAGQTAKSQNGLYQIGVVAAGTAPLTRIADFPTGAIFAKGNAQICELGGEGTLFGNTLWKITTTGPITVDTTAHDWFPRQVTQSVTLVAGTVTVTNVPILSATKSNFIGTRTTANTTASTVTYNAVGAVTPGIAGTASLVFDACVAAGTINAADISTLSLTIINF